MKNVLTMRKDKVMKQYTKYICVFLMMIGISTSAWGTNDVFSYNKASINFGTFDASDEEYVEAGGIIISQTITVTISQAASVKAYMKSSYSTWGDCCFYLDDVGNEGFIGSSVGSHTFDIYTYLALENGTFKDTIVIYDESENNMEEIPVIATVTGAVTCDANATFTTTGTPTTTSSLRSTSVSVNNVGLSSLGATGCSITSYGYCWGTSANPTTSGSHYEVGTTYTTTGTAFGSYSITGLTANQKYYIRPYATNGNGTAYGPEVNVTTLQRYTITYNKNDGGGASATEYKDHGISYTISSNKYSRSGYTLVKWHTLAAGTGGTDYAKGASYTSNAALNLYAVWGGTISFNNNGGTGSMSSEVVVSGDSYELPSCTFTPPSGKRFKCWAQGAADGTERAVGYSHTVAGDITFYAVWRDEQYTDYKFSCADWSVTGPSGDTVFITSTASKTVRSQEAFHVTASGLPASTALTFTTFPANTRFAFKKADGSAISTDSYGKVNTDFYVFYTPTSGDTSDGLDEITKIYVSVSGEPRTATIDTKRIIGRHLPADFVIAAKKDGKWWVMPSNMASTTNPTPVEIAVNDATNPSIAYTLSNTYYGLAGPTAANISGGNGQYIRFAMSINDGTLDPHAAPLFGTTGTTLGKSGSSQITSDLSAGNWWKLVQTNTSITNPQDAKYTIYCANNTQSLTLEDGGLWGLYATNGTDVDELRLVPARSGVSYEEAEIVEWGQHSAIVEVDTHLGYHTKVKAKLNGAETGFITLSQTKTSVSEVDTKYNYTVNFGDGIDFAAAASNGAMLTLEWYNTSEVLQSVSNITVPKIIASSATMSTIESRKTQWQTWEVHVLPGVTLEANAGLFSSSNVTIKDLQIYPGATVKITSGTLDVTNLSLRNGWTRATTKKYDVARLQIKADANLTHTNAYLDWYIDNDQYYPIAVPFPVTVSAITYLNTKNTVTIGGVDGVIRLRYFDGANRAAGNSGNWKYYGEDGGLAVPAQLLPSMGYAMAAKRPGGKAFSIVRMPMTFANEWTALGEQGSATVAEVALRKDTVHVFAYGNEKTAEWNKGWNLIGNPYMAVFHGDDSEEGIYGKILAVSKVNEEGGEKLRYVTIPNSSFTDYAQVQYKDTLLKPSSSFLVQVKDTGRLEFSNSKIDKPTAPARYTATPTKAPEQEAYIRLSYEGGYDQMGLIIGVDYTAAYETNADLMKMLGEEQNTLKTYMMYNDVEMAYVAINEDLASEWIPITVRIPETGEYTYSLTRASEIDNLEGVYLIDYETNTVTNLIENNYSFVADEGTIDDRFAINAIVGRHETPTDIDIINAGGDVKSDKPVKFIYNDKVFILHNGVIYDASGKKVREINR